MPKVIHNNPLINRSGTSARQVLFQLNFNAYDAVSASGTITFKVSANEDFSGSSTVTPTTFYYRTTSNGTWTSVAGNTVTLAQQAYYLRADLTALASETKQYVKVIFTVGGVAYESSAILFTNLTEIEFNMQNPIVTGTVKPTKVKVMDSIKATYSSPYTIKVEVCNNANDASPTWENATTKYLDGDFYDFTNNTKTASNWAIGVKYYIKKNNAADSIEITDLYIAFF